MKLRCKCGDCGDEFEVEPQGGHRLLCGDATSRADVERLLAGAKPHLMVADPPYGTSFARGKFLPPWKTGKRKFAPIEGDELRGDELGALIEKVLGHVSVQVVYCWSLPLTEGIAIAIAIAKAGFRIQSQIVWRKGNLILGRADYQWKHEICWYGFRGKNHPWYGGRDQTTVWDIAKPSAMEDHPTQKPIECMKFPIENSSAPGDAVYDPFCGSFTTGIACELTGRRAYCLEIAPEYVDVGVLRWQTFSKKEAILEATGQTMTQVRAQRLADETKGRGCPKAAPKEKAPRKARSAIAAAS